MLYGAEVGDSPSPAASKGLVAPEQMRALLASAGVKLSVSRLERLYRLAGARPSESLGFSQFVHLMHRGRTAASSEPEEHTSSNAGRVGGREESDRTLLTYRRQAALPS